MEAIFANSIDLTCVGPSLALNAYVRSRGAEVRLIAGAATGGRAGRGGTFGQKSRHANTQDGACRVWLAARGFMIMQLGGDVQVIPTANPDQIGVLFRKTLNAVRTSEPWVSRLELEAKGKVYVEKTGAITTALRLWCQVFAAASKSGDKSWQRRTGSPPCGSTAIQSRRKN
jgi:NitT/TauT family transport system substrate-binding protein